MYPSTSSATYLHSTAVLRGRVSVEPRISPTHTPHTVCRANASQLDMLHTGRVLGKTPVSGTARSHSSSGVFLSRLDRAASYHGCMCMRVTISYVQ